MGKQTKKWRALSAFFAAVLVMTSANVPVYAETASTQTVASEAYTWNNAQIHGGGFVPGIIFNETEPNLIYARTDIGGAYRWDETSQSWTCITDSVGWSDWNKNGVDALATDPVDPDRVYMATGTYTNSWDTNGQIMRSTDRGNTWQTTPLPFKVGGNMPGRSMGERLMVDPNDNSIIYFGARGDNGLWKSTDYGATWNRVTSFKNTGTYIQSPGSDYGSDPIGIAWITFDKTTGQSGSATQTIYIGIADTGNSIYRSTDGGATWSALAGQPTGYLPHHGELSSTGKLYITYSNGCGPYDGSKGEVWKYNTANNVWTNISPVDSSSSDNYFGYGGLALDAQNPDTLMIATLNSWWPDGNIYRSTDGGATWTSAWSWLSYPTRSLKYNLDISDSPWLNFGVNGEATGDSPSPQLGWMMGDLEIDPFNSDRFLYGTGASLMGSTNLSNWGTSQKITIRPIAKGIEETAVCALVSLPTGSSHLLSGLGDIGGFRHEDLTTVPSYGYTSPIFTSTTGIDYAENNPSYVVRVGNVDRDYTTNKACAFSNDGGSTWFSTNAEPEGVAGGGQIAVSADGSSVLWSPNPKTAGASISVYKTTNNGNSWTACNGLPAQAEICSDRVNPDKFYGFKNGVFYVSTDGGSSFTQTNATGLPVNVAAVVHGQAEKPICTFKAVPGMEGELWFAGGSAEEGVYGLWHSTDSGESFTRLSNVEEADTIGFGKAADGQDYMALYTTAQIDGVRGIFRSDDTGATWVRINDDQNQYAKINMCITGDPRIYGRVYVGTNGRGIIYGDTQTTPVPGSQITPTSASFDKNTEQQKDIDITMTLNGNTLMSIKNGSNQLVSGTDYTISDTKVTLHKAYLAAQNIGTTVLTFDFSAGSDPSLSIRIIDSTQQPPVEPSDLQIQMFNGQTAATTNTIGMKFKITNNGSEPINLSDVKVRYYYTADSAKGQSFWCDWASAGSENVTGTFSALSPSKTGADNYFELGFTSAAGTLNPGSSAELQLRIAKNDWSNYDQTNDYSFRSTGSSYADWSYVTGYVNGALSWGTEP